MGRELESVGEVVETGADHQPGWIDAGGDQVGHPLSPFGQAEAAGLARGAEGGQPDAALAEETVGVLREKIGGDRPIVVEGGEEGPDQAAERRFVDGWTVPRERYRR